MRDSCDDSRGVRAFSQRALAREVIGVESIRDDREFVALAVDQSPNHPADPGQADSSRAQRCRYLHHHDLLETRTGRSPGTLEAQEGYPLRRDRLLSLCTRDGERS